MIFCRDFSPGFSRLDSPACVARNFLRPLADGHRVFEQGQADVKFCALVEVLLMNDTDPPDLIEAIAAVDYSNGSDLLLARGASNSAITCIGAYDSRAQR